jgi:hypothetical protein
MDGGDGLLSQNFPFTLDGHTIIVITGIALTPTIVVGITGKDRYSRAAGAKPL